MTHDHGEDTVPHAACVAAIQATLHAEAKALLEQATKNERTGHRKNRDWCYAAAFGYERARGLLRRRT